MASGHIGQHFDGIDRVFRILDIARDLGIVHPAALRLARIIHHAGGQFQIGFRQRIGIGGGGEIRRRIIGGIEAVGGGILQPRDDALAGRGQRAALRPQRGEVTRGVEFLDRGPLGLAVEIARRLAAQQILELVGDRLIRGRDVARGLDRLGGGSRGGRRRRGGRVVAVSFLAVSALSVAGAVTTSDGFASDGLASGAFSAAFVLLHPPWRRRRPAQRCPA